MIASAELRLHHAELMLSGSTSIDSWPRCATWLIRLALESALRALWQTQRPAVATCSTRAQLLALVKVRGPDVQRRATELWITLSRAAHHHHYELAPSAQEIHGWLRDARELADELGDRSPASG